MNAEAQQRPHQLSPVDQTPFVKGVTILKKAGIVRWLETPFLSEKHTDFDFQIKNRFNMKISIQHPYPNL